MQKACLLPRVRRQADAMCRDRGGGGAGALLEAQEARGPGEASAAAAARLALSVPPVCDGLSHRLEGQE